MGVNSLDGETLASLAATGVDDGAAALGGHAGPKADLADALFAVWTEGGLHRCKSLKGPTEVPHAPSAVKVRLSVSDGVAVLAAFAGTGVDARNRIARDGLISPETTQVDAEVVTAQF